MSFLSPPSTLTLRKHMILFVVLDREDTLDDVPPSKKQKLAAGLLPAKLHKQDFAGPLSSRASRVLGPISRHRVADIPAPHETGFACFSSWITRGLPAHPL